MPEPYKEVAVLVPLGGRSISNKRNENRKNLQKNYVENLLK